jgi:type IV pilus modification protein PilV
MNSTRTFRRLAGFSLLEVLVAVVVLSFGLLALASLQGSLFKASTETKAQSVALGLAAEKIEFFRGYSTQAAYQAIDSSTAAETMTVGGVAYSRTWTVNRYAYPAAGGNFTSVNNTATLSTTTYADTNEFKRIAVSVTWKDAENKNQTVALEDAIGGVDPGDSRNIGKLGSGATPRGPEVRIYDPSQQQEGVIPIAIGGDASCTGGACAAATNPKPLINGTNVIETRFDVMTYSGVSGNTALAQSRVETSVLGCSCDYGNKPTDTSILAKRPTYWNGYRYVDPEDADYAPKAGVLASASNQSALCSICCRDHHDPSTLASTDPKFDPRNAQHSSGHYPMNATTGALGARTLTGPYTESCRVIRVGGNFRVAADTYDDYMNLLATKNDSSTTAYLPTTTATTNYQNFVISYLAARDVTASTANLNDVLPITAPATVTSLETANSINSQTPISYSTTGPAKWLHLRGLYVDWLEDSAVQAIADAKTNCKGTSGAPPTTAQTQVCVLKVLPFTSINLTELGNWTPFKGTDPGYSQIVVANNNFADTLISTAPVRGKVSLGSSPTSGTTTNAVGKTRRSNSGLTTLVGGIDVSSTPVSTDDASTTPPGTWSATQPFTISGSSGSSGVNFNLNFYAPASGTSYPFTSNTKTPAINNTAGSITCNGIANAIACSSATALAAPQTITVGQYNYATTGTSSTALTCTNGAGGSLTYTGPYATKVCRNYAVSSVTVNGTTVATGPLTPTGTDGLLAETTSFTFSSPVLTGTTGNTMNITFGTPVDTVQPSTCTYSTVCKNKTCTQTTTTYTVVAPACP